jgi:hypothetical protein
MDFRRSGQLDGRRRRVLMDASPGADAEKDETKPAPSSARGPVRAYAAAVLTDRQPHLADLIPRRAFTVVMLALIGLTVIASIEAIYIHLQPMLIAGANLPGIDLLRPGSLSQWFSSVVLALGAAMSLMIYSIRVHRVDDYRGRYRVWLWTAGALVWASISTATSIHESLNVAAQQIPGVGHAGMANHLWLAAYAVVFGGLAVRLTGEVWPSLETFAGLAISATLYVLAIVLELGLLSVEGAVLATVAQSSAVMLAHGMLVYSLALYGRHVHLDAQGRLLVKVEKAKRKKSKSKAKLSVVSSDEAAEPRRKKAAGEKTAPAAKAGTTKTDAAKSDSAKPDATKTETKPAGASISAATLKSPVTPVKPLAVAGRDNDDEDEDEQDGDSPSRTERRRLKKLAQQGGNRDQQRRAA